MKRMLVLFLVTALLAGCTKTDDYLRQQFVAHSDLVDPGSSMFRNITHKSSPLDTWCGEVNAKNRMGGYVGWAPFDMTILSNDVVNITIYQSHESSPSANGPQQEAITRLRQAISNSHKLQCEGTKPASKWVSSSQ